MTASAAQPAETEAVLPSGAAAAQTTSTPASTPTPKPSRRLKNERWAVAAVFAVHGSTSGTFASRLPWIADHLHLGSGALGAALLMASIGSLTMMPLAGRSISKYGGKAATRALIIALCVLTPVSTLVPNVWLLGVDLLLVGAVAGTADMAMNVQGIDVEARLGRPIMSSLHGAWSLGVLVSASIGSAVAGAHIDARAHFAVAAAVLAVIAFAATALFTGGRDEPVVNADGVAEAAEPTPWLILPKGRILVIALVGFCAVFAEIAANDWSAVYMRRTLGSGEARAAFTTAMFALTMTIGRLSGDHVVRKFGAEWVVRVCGAVGATGGLLIVVTHSPLLATAGFMMIGLGVALIVPLAFTAAGNAASNPAVAVAGVATISYGAGLAAPSIIGGVASFTSLRIAFVLVAVCAALVAAGGGLLGTRKKAAEGADGAIPSGEGVPVGLLDVG